MDYKKMINLIESSDFFNKYGLKYAWLSGSSTKVYPIEIWEEMGEIEIQIDSLVEHSGMTNAFKKLYNNLCKEFDLKGWYYNKSDGSCPQTYIIYYKEFPWEE